MLFQQLSVAAIGVLQHAHLPDGYPVEFDEPFSLRHALSDEYGIEVFHVRQADQFVDGGIIADVAFAVGVGFAPLLCRHAEHRYVQRIGFVGVDDACLCRSVYSSLSSTTRALLTSRCYILMGICASVTTCLSR